MESELSWRLYLGPTHRKRMCLPLFFGFACMLAHIPSNGPKYPFCEIYRFLIGYRRNRVIPSVEKPARSDGCHDLDKLDVGEVLAQFVEVFRPCRVRAAACGRCKGQCGAF